MTPSEGAGRLAASEAYHVPQAQHVWNERTVLTELSEGPAPFPRCCRLHATLKDGRPAASWY